MKKSTEATLLNDQIVPLYIQHLQRNIQRCGLASKLHSYDLKQHGFGVLSICLDMIKLLDCCPYSVKEIEAILFHDILEAVTGDLPAVVKEFSSETKVAWEIIEDQIVSSPQYSVLSKYTDKSIKETMQSDLHYEIFKFADILDLLFYVLEEEVLGNQSNSIEIIKKDIVTKVHNRIANIASMFDDPEKVVGSICSYLNTSEYNISIEVV